MACSPNEKSQASYIGMPIRCQFIYLTSSEGGCGRRQCRAIRNDAPEGAPMPVQTPTPHLQKSLKERHLKMISLGGVIGAGLFVGSSAIIAEAGPGAFITYGITGILVFLVMR